MSYIPDFMSESGMIARSTNQSMPSSFISRHQGSNSFVSMAESGQIDHQDLFSQQHPLNMPNSTSNNCIVAMVESGQVDHQVLFPQQHSSSIPNSTGNDNYMVVMAESGEIDHQNLFHQQPPPNLLNSTSNHNCIVAMVESGQIDHQDLFSQQHPSNLLNSTSNDNRMRPINSTSDISNLKSAFDSPALHNGRYPQDLTNTGVSDCDTLSSSVPVLDPFKRQSSKLSNEYGHLNNKENEAQSSHLNDRIAHVELLLGSFGKRLGQLESTSRGLEREVNDTRVGFKNYENTLNNISEKVRQIEVRHQFLESTAFKINQFQNLVYNMSSQITELSGRVDENSSSIIEFAKKGGHSCEAPQKLVRRTSSCENSAANISREKIQLEDTEKQVLQCVSRLDGVGEGVEEMKNQLTRFQQSQEVLNNRIDFLSTIQDTLGGNLLLVQEQMKQTTIDVKEAIETQERVLKRSIEDLQKQNFQRNQQEDRSAPIIQKKIFRGRTFKWNSETESPEESTRRP